MKILIVEDHVDVLDCLRSYFIGRGFEVETASTVPDAMELVRHGAPDVAFIDLRLSGGDGELVVKEIARLREVNPKAPMTRIVVITADDDLKRRQELMRYGVSNYLFKPITIRDLEELVNSIMVQTMPSPMEEISSEEEEQPSPPVSQEPSQNE